MDWTCADRIMPGEEKMAEDLGQAREHRIVKAKELLEFYFGDSNLLKDRFLTERIRQSDEGWVPISVLITFNKLKVATQGDQSEVREAAQKSTELGVNTDGTSVRRLKPMPEKDDTDSRTLYLEGIGTEITHDEIKAMITPHGEVTYISIPRFKDPAGGQGKAKGARPFSPCHAKSGTDLARNSQGFAFSSLHRPLSQNPRCPLCT